MDTDRTTGIAGVTQILFCLGFSGNIGDISYNLNASIAKYSGIESTDKILSASFSVPL